MWTGRMSDKPVWDVFVPDTKQVARVWSEERVKQLGVKRGARYELVIWLATQANVWFAEVRADGCKYAALMGVYDTFEDAEKAYGLITVDSLPGASVKKITNRAKGVKLNAV